jgi:putative DNA primase/helicase
MITSLDDLVAKQRWVAWCNERRGEKLTKVPYCGEGRKAQANNPKTWRTRRDAEACARAIVDGLGGGIGIMLGDLGEDLALFGVDLDTCRDQATGIFEPWAAEVIDRFESYTEISPSGTGCKVFALVGDAALAEVRAATEIKYGKTFARRNGAAEHPPAIEVHIGNRYFAVTDQRLDNSPAELAIVPPEALLWLLCEHGPAFASAASGTAKGKTGGTDKSRSATAFGKGAELRRAGKTYDEMVEALRADPETAHWCRDKGEANDQRELKRIWSRAAAQTHASDVPAFSEEALALQLADEHGGHLRHTAAWSRWFLWSHTHWRADETLTVFDLARSLCRGAGADPRAGKLARAIASAKTVAAVCALARSDRRIATEHTQWDADAWRLAGVETIDLRTGATRAPLPEDMCTKVTGATPDDRGCPLWLAFLDRVTAGDREMQAYLQRVAGYCLTGSTREHCLFFCYGTGANGKSVFVNTLRAIWGDYAVVAPMETFIESQTDRHPTELAHLRGARLVVTQETERGRRWAESKVKSMTAGDAIVARQMRQDFFEFTPQFKLLVAGNHKPGLRGVDESIRRRMHLIPFTVTIPPGERDKGLSDKLRGEWGGILQWAIDGCLAWQETGLAAPQAVVDATDKYLHDEDAHGTWIEERCALDRIYSASSTDLYNSWKGWSEAAGEHPGSQRRFSQSLEARGFTKRHDRTGAMFFGIALRP